MYYKRYGSNALIFWKSVTSGRGRVPDVVNLIQGDTLQHHPIEHDAKQYSVNNKRHETIQKDVVQHTLVTVKNMATRPLKF